MGKTKNTVPQYVFNFGQSLDKHSLREEVKELIEKGTFDSKSLLYEYLQEIVPYAGEKHYIYVVNDNGTFVNIPFNREGYINALCCLSQYELTLFMHPASFSGWVTENDCRAARCIIIDIDDINMYADITDKDTAVSFIKETYSLEDWQLPKWISLSGRGIHLIYPIDEMYFWDPTKTVKIKSKKYSKPVKAPCPYRSKCSDAKACTDENVCINRLIYKKYNACLILKFDADFSGNNINHMFRNPTSYNLKGRSIKGKLFKVNENDSTHIHRLDWALRTDEEILEYRRAYYKRCYEKSLITKAKNAQRKQEFLDSLGDMTLEEFLKQDNISPEDRVLAEKLLEKQREKEKKSKKPKKDKKKKTSAKAITEADIDDIFENTALPYKKLKYRTNFKPENRYWNLLLDLHNYLIRHKGIVPSRNFFFFVIANYLKKLGHPDYYAVKYCRQYCDKSYYKEMKQTVLATYKNEVTYNFTYEYLAFALAFSEEDIRVSYCNFSKERKMEAKRKNNQKQYAKTLEKKGKLSFKEKRAFQLQFLKDNPDITDKEAMLNLGIGRTTFYTLKNELKAAATI